MKIYRMSSDEFAKLEPLHLIEGTLEKESDMFYMPNSKDKIVKVYKNRDDRDYLKSKILACYNLIHYVQELDFNELLVPDGFLKVDSHIVGPVYPKIIGYTARIYLGTVYDTPGIKIEILKNIGQILRKIALSNSKYNTAFADVHADNFIVNGIPFDNVTGKRKISITACDTDSMKILSSPGITGYYLYDYDKMSDFLKYPLDKYGFVKATTNTDIYCYIMMILDYISKSSYVYTLNVDEYYRYLDYLNELGFDSNLLTSFASVYEDDKDNICPLNYLDSLLNMDVDASLTSFYVKSRKK